MPEIKNTFTQGKMNKDLDERIIPNGQYRDAMNVQISTSEGSDIGTVQNILGNTRVENIIPSNFICIGSIPNEKTNKIYWFVKSDSIDAILEYSEDNGIVPIIIDTKAGTDSAVLKFSDNIITGINIIENLLLWTDNINEPRKINIERCKLGNETLTDLSSALHTKLVVDGNIVEKEVSTTATNSGNLINSLEVLAGPLGKLKVNDRLVSIQNNGVDITISNIVVSGNNATITLNDITTWSSGDEIIFSIKEEIKEQDITTIKKGPLKPINFKINKAASNNKNPLFKKIFPRFSYRYRYTDGEYSVFAPFTNIVFNSAYIEDQHTGFLYDANNMFTEKEPYNTGMINMIESVELTDFVSPDIPDDVTQIDLLYKEEGSNNIYVLEIIKNTSAEWLDEGSDPNSSYKGSFLVEGENIFAALPSNQLLRHWDNVPRKALAQEITGNRLVYANYLQNYDLKSGGADIVPRVITDYQKKYKDDSTTLYDFSSGGLQSLKSQRNYHLGVVYGDKYGRETPVFTSQQSSVIVPWETTDDGTLWASESTQLCAYLGHSHPDWAHYFKFFVKETSGEYYNLVMDAAYNPTVEDIIDDHIWISFASADRNKVSEEDYLILKKKVNTSEQIKDENKFKILDIKNEAPDAIKYKFANLGNIPNDTSPVPSPYTGTNSNAGILNYNVFQNAEKSFIPDSSNTLDEPVLDEIHIYKTEWNAEGGADLMVNPDSAEMADEDLYFSFFKDDGGTIQSSERYRISSIRKPSSVYIIKLTRGIKKEDFQFAETSSNSGVIHEDVGVLIEKKLTKDLSAFSGRFFVKILSTSLTKTEIEGNTAVDILRNYSISMTDDLYWYADQDNTSDMDPNNGLINNTYNGTDPTGTSGTAPSEITGHSGDSTTRTPTDWEVLPQKEFFIDNMYMVASMTDDSSFARFAGQGWFGGKPEGVIQPTVTGGNNPGNDPVADIYHHAWYHMWSNPSSYNFSGTVGGWRYTSQGNHNDTDYLLWPRRNVIKQTDITTSGGTAGDKLINGLDGNITTDSTHVGSDGIRRWKNNLFDNTLDTTYGSEDDTGKFYIHISFLAPGEDLHDNTGWTSNYSLKNKPYSYSTHLCNNLQGVHGGGIFTKEDGSQIFGNTNNPPHTEFGVFMEGTGSGANEHPSGYDQSYQDRHDNQWNPSWPVSSDPDGKIAAFVNNLEPGKKFRFQGAAKDDVYTILRRKIKKVYNHTPWRKTWENDGSGNLVLTGNSVEEKALAWAETLNFSAYDGDDAKATAMKNAIVDFGKASNRRLVYVLELDKDPKASTSYNPTNGTNIDAETPGVLEFVIEDFDLSAGEVTQQPAIWETEPKDNVDLDIYYEASQAYPIDITKDTRELFAPIGSKVEILNIPEARNGNLDLTSTPIYLQSWELEKSTFILSPGFNDRDGSGNVIDYTDARIRFFREDGSFTTGKINNTTAVLTGDYRTEFKLDTTIDPSSKIGLSWYNCFSFGNGIESNRIRDDFNASTITNGVKASSTMNRPYQEDHRPNGLIYSSIYNSTSETNGLNEFIMAEKITKDLNPTYGSIQKLFQRRSSASYGDTLIAFCEDRVIGITSNKDALYNADGKPQLVSSNAVLGDANPFIGDYGISKNPESFASESYRAYFTDKQRGAVLRLSMDGLTPISDAGMHDYFRDNLKTAGKLIGTYDEYKKDYNLTLTNFLPNNIITNAFITEGSGSITNFVNPQEIIVNGGINNGDSYTHPTYPSQDLHNDTLESRTTITNHAAINTGDLIAAVPYQAPVPPTTTPATDPVFTSIASPGTTVYLFDNINYQTSDPYDDSPQIIVSNREGVTNASSWQSRDTTIHWRNSSSSGDDEFFWWGDDLDADAWLGVDLSLLPGNNFSGVGDQVPTATNSDGISVSSAYGGQNNTFYNGEEFFIIVQAKNIDSSPVKLRIELYDGTPSASTLIDSSKFHVPTGGSLPFSDTSHTPIQDTSFKLGFQSNNPVVFPDLTQPDLWETHRVDYKVTNGTTDEGIVINDLRILIYNDEGTASGQWRTRDIKLVKKYSYDVPGILEITSGSTIPEVLEVFAEPPYDIPAWAEVTHDIDSDVDGNQDWVDSVTGTGQISLNVNAITTYGAEHVGINTTGTQNSTSVNNVAPQTWLEPPMVSSSFVPSNGLVVFDDGSGGGNMYTDGDYMTDDKITILALSANGHLEQDLSINSNNFIVDNWYEVIIKYIGTPTDAPIINGVTDQSLASGTQIADHIGVTTGGSHKGIKMVDNGNGEFRTIFKFDSNSTFNTNNEQHRFRVQFYDMGATITSIERYDISSTGTGGQLNLSSHDWITNSQVTLLNYYTTPEIYYQNNKVHWDNATQGSHLRQDFDPSSPQTTTDGYELKFTISNYSGSGSMWGYVNNEIGDATPTTFEGFYFSGIDSDGEYVVTANMDGTVTGMTKDGIAYGSVVPTSTVLSNTNSGYDGKMIFNPDGSTPFTGSINHISLRDISTLFSSGGGIESWNFTGFDTTLDDFISFDSVNENILFTNAPVNSSGISTGSYAGSTDPIQIEQLISKSVKLKESYRVKFDYDISGDINGYYFNNYGQGFRIGTLTGSGSYDILHEIGDESLASGELYNTFVIYVETGNVNGTLDNFVMQQEFPEFVPSTITYSEDVKGWVSFKSFIPESGVSVSRNFFTMQNGQLWQHHSNEIRNWFYGVTDTNGNPEIEESSITAIFNTDPSLVKIFNTLNYEGSQSKVDKFKTDNSTGTTLSNISTYNLTDKLGWYVDSINTDKQSGFLNEFMEKEGKWFNYIKGDNNDIKTSDLSFQGLGIVKNVN